MSPGIPDVYFALLPDDIGRGRRLVSSEVQTALATVPTGCISIVVDYLLQDELATVWFNARWRSMCLRAAAADRSTWMKCSCCVVL